MKTYSIDDLKIAYIGGGSRGWAWKLMADLALEDQIRGEVRLYDIDYKAAFDNVIIADRLNKQKDVRSRWKYTAFENLDEALYGADFVIISILPGTMQEFYSDVHMPEKYGIYQSVGDTVGPGGLFRALRAIPMYVRMAEAIKKYAPDAWVINYTNPMTLCTRTLYEVFPGIKAFGCCHEVFGAQSLLAQALEDIKNINCPSREEIIVEIVGINHFTFFTKAHYKGIDLFPIFKEFSDKYYDSGFYHKEMPKEWMEKNFGYNHRVKFDLFREYGVIPAAGDRHLAEFVPDKYLVNPESIEFWGFYLTPVPKRMENRQKIYEKAERLIAGMEEMELVPSNEEGVRLIKGLLGLGDFTTNVNFPNMGQIEDVPPNCIVETNVHISCNSIKPQLSGIFPENLKKVMLRHINNQEAILRAALNKDGYLAFKAFINDPLIKIKEEDALLLYKEMAYNTKEYLDPALLEPINLAFTG